jgi:uncharacterized protein (TIGR03435 family)
MSARPPVKMLSGQLGAPVTDDTGLRDKYDYAMTWIPEAPGSIPAENQDLGGPSLINAVQEQLGLKLTGKERAGRVHRDRPRREDPTENRFATGQNGLSYLISRISFSLVRAS